jgi:hypothetical protein
VAEVDFFLSPLCRPIDEGLYEVEPSIREVLLVELENQFGLERLFRLANFLQLYLAHKSGWKQRPELTRTQRWIAQAYIDPNRVVEELTNLLESSLSIENHLLNLPDQIQITTALELLAEPLERATRRREYQHLANNSRLLAHILYGNEEELKETTNQEEIRSETNEEVTILSSLVANLFTAKDKFLKKDRKNALDVEKKEQNTHPNNSKGNTRFWKPVYQVLKPEEPLTNSEDMRDFYVQRSNSPIETLVSLIEMADDPAKFLLAGHRGSGTTTELRRLEQELANTYTVIWIDTEIALDRYNIGYAEVVLLISQKICRQAIQPGWWSKKDTKLLKDLEDSLKNVIYQDKKNEVDGFDLPDLLTKMGLVLKRGLTRQVTKTINIRPLLSETITRVNAIIQAAEQDRNQKLLIIVDGLHRHDQATALEMFSSPLLAEFNCHIIYSIPISLRYSRSFRQTIESFQKCLDLTNLPVFECGNNLCPTTSPNQLGRELLINVINKRLARLGDTYKGLFNPDALELICEKSGGVMRDLVRLARTACEVALRSKLIYVDLGAAKEAVQEVRREYNLSDYHYPELDRVHRTGLLTTNTHSLPNKGEFVICDELLQNKFVLRYKDESGNIWFDVNPILLEDLQRWQSTNR